MKILVINLGSSSLKAQYFIDKLSIATVLIEKIKETSSYSKIEYQNKITNNYTTISNYSEAIDMMLFLLKESNALLNIDILDAIGHRVVHGGSNFSQSILIDKSVIDEINSLSSLAPLHNPINLIGIEELHKTHSHIPQVAVFDTAFHQTIPQHASLYPIPYKLQKELDIKRYGFHGTSHSFVSKEASKILKQNLNNLNLITLHLGNGASATAIRGGKSIDTSMGLTPLEGLMMGTRSGDIDPAIIKFLLENSKNSIENINNILLHNSGLKGICGVADMREVIQQAKDKDSLSILALDMYIHRVKKYIGSYSVILGRVDAIVFTGGIGENSPIVREMVCRELEESIGAKIDIDKNISIETPFISDKNSKIKILVIPTNEELEIATQTQQIVEEISLS